MVLRLQDWPKKYRKNGGVRKANYRLVHIVTPADRSSVSFALFPRSYLFYARRREPLVEKPVLYFVT